MIKYEKNKYKIFAFLSYRKNFVGTQKRVRLSRGKRVIGVRAIEVRLYKQRRTVTVLERSSKITAARACVRARVRVCVCVEVSKT